MPCLAHAPRAGRDPQLGPGRPMETCALLRLRPPTGGSSSSQTFTQQPLGHGISPSWAGELFPVCIPRNRERDTQCIGLILPVEPPPPFGIEGQLRRPPPAARCPLLVVFVFFSLSFESRPFPTKPPVRPDGDVPRPSQRPRRGPRNPSPEPKPGRRPTGTASPPRRTPPVL